MISLKVVGFVRKVEEVIAMIAAAMVMMAVEEEEEEEVMRRVHRWRYLRMVHTSHTSVT